MALERHPQVHADVREWGSHAVVVGVRHRIRIRHLRIDHDRAIDAGLGSPEVRDLARREGDGGALPADPGDASLFRTVQGGLVTSGAGRIVLSGNNTYTGATIISNQETTLRDGGRLSGTSSITITFEVDRNGGDLLLVYDAFGGGDALARQGAVVLHGVTDPDSVFVC